jgi:hypothetical protein
MRFASFKSAAVGAALALAIGAGGIAAPAQAASLSFNFGGGGMSMGPGGPGGPGMHFHYGDRRYFDYCLDDNGIERRLERRGYDNVHVIRHNHGDDSDNKVWVVAQDYRGDWYMMRVDRCSHDVDHVRRVHGHNDHGGFDPNNFHFSFSF